MDHRFFNSTLLVMAPTAPWLPQEEHHKVQAIPFATLC
jgi:hypothetical protein